MPTCDMSLVKIFGLEHNGHKSIWIQWWNLLEGGRMSNTVKWPIMSLTLCSLCGVYTQIIGPDLELQFQCFPRGWSRAGGCWSPVHFLSGNLSAGTPGLISMETSNVVLGGIAIENLLPWKYSLLMSVLLLTIVGKCQCSTNTTL